MSQANMRGRGRGSGAEASPYHQGCSQESEVLVGTVSRVLNGNKSVGADIKARVERTIAQLDYQPDAVAQGMRSGSTRSVGFIIRDITVPALAAFVKAAQAVCHDDRPRDWSHRLTLSSRERVQGYKDAFAAWCRRRLRFDPHSQFHRRFRVHGRFALLRGRNRPTAVVAGGISMLTGILRAISTERLRIPQDISVIGAGDSELAELIKPPVTVVRWTRA